MGAHLRSVVRYLALAGLVGVGLSSDFGLARLEASASPSPLIQSVPIGNARAARATASSKIPPPPSPSVLPQPVPGHSGDYYVTCYSAHMTPPCQQAVVVQVLKPGSSIQDVFQTVTFLCREPECNYRDFETSLAG